MTQLPNTVKVPDQTVTTPAEGDHIVATRDGVITLFSAATHLLSGAERDAFDRTGSTSFSAENPVASMGDLAQVASLDLFNPSACTLNAYISASGVMTASTDYAVSDYIPVTVGRTYSVTKDTGLGARFVAAYDQNLAVVPSAGSNTRVEILTVPSGVAFYRVSFSKSAVSTVQFVEGTRRIASLTFGPQPRHAEKLIQQSTANWGGIGWASFGDSITAQRSWQPHVTSELRLPTELVVGVGGRRVSGASGMCQDASIAELSAAIGTTYKIGLIGVMGGTNDWANNVALGGVSSTDTATFCGALNVMCAKLVALWPTARIVLIQPPYGEIAARVTDPGYLWPSASTNSLGLTVADYGAAMATVARRWGCACADTQLAGVNGTNYASFVTDGLHPNAEFGKRIAGVVVATLRSIPYI